MATKTQWRKALRSPTPVINPAFMPRDRVHIDGCQSLVGVITAVQWRCPEIINYEVSWVGNGESKHDVIEGWRLSRVED
jgi:hypothetical protein